MYTIYLVHSNNRRDYTISYQRGDYSLDEKGGFIRVRVVANSRSVQLSTAVTFRCGLFYRTRSQKEDRRLHV